MNAINKIRGDSNVDRISAEDIQPTNPARFENYSTVQMPLGDGNFIELSVKDPALYAALREQYKDPSKIANVAAVKALQFYSRFHVDMLTKYDWTFGVRNLERAMIDHNFNTLDGKIFQNYIPVVSQLKILAEMVYNPKIYEQFRQEYGLSDRLVREYRGLTTDQIVEKLSSGKQANGILRGVDNLLTGFTDRGDALTRMLEYKLTYNASIARGLPEAAAKDAALIAAKNIHLNFSQRGANATFNSVVQAFPFGRAFINAADKQARFFTYAPLRAAKGAASIYVMYKAIQQWNNSFVDKQGIPIDRQVDPRIADTFWWIRTGPGVNDMFRISNGWFGGHLGQAEGMFPELDLSRLTGRDVATAWSNATTKLITPDAFAPAGVVPLINAGSVAMTGNPLINPQGNPIVPTTKAGDPAHLNYFQGSTDSVLAGITQELSQKGIEINPQLAQYFAREIGGAFGEATLISGAHIYGMMSGMNPPMAERGSIPGFNLISGNNSDVPHTGVESQFYKMAETVAQVEETEAKLKKQATEHPEYAPIYAKFLHDNADELHYGAIFKQTGLALAQIKREIGQISGADHNTLTGYQEKNPSLLGDEKKRQNIDALRIHAQTNAGCLTLF